MFNLTPHGKMLYCIGGPQHGKSYAINGGTGLVFPFQYACQELLTNMDTVIGHFDGDDFIPEPGWRLVELKYKLEHFRYISGGVDIEGWYLRYEHLPDTEARPMAIQHLMMKVLQEIPV